MANLGLPRKEYLLLAILFLFYADQSLFAQASTHPLQVITLGVQDQRGQFVNNIQPDQVVVKGVKATVRHMEVDDEPRRTLLLLDTSGNMGGPKSLSWSNVARFAIRFCQQRKGDDSIGLDAFAEKDQVQVPLTTDSQSLIRRTEALTISGRGRTMLGLALTEILARRENGLRFGDAIVLVSDGERSDADKTNFGLLRDDLTRAGIRICLVRVPPIMGRGATIEANDVSKFVKETGGIEFNLISPMVEIQPFNGALVDPDTLASTASAAYAFVQTYYRLDLEVSEPIQKPHQLQLELVDRERRKIQGLHLNYPHYLGPPSTN